MTAKKLCSTLRSAYCRYQTPGCVLQLTQVPFVLYSLPIDALHALFPVSAARSSASSASSFPTSVEGCSMRSRKDAGEQDVAGSADRKFTEQAKLVKEEQHHSQAATGLPPDATVRTITFNVRTIGYELWGSVSSSASQPCSRSARSPNSSYIPSLDTLYFSPLLPGLIGVPPALHKGQDSGA